jgi:hypothetical protein
MRSQNGRLEETRATGLESRIGCNAVRYWRHADEMVGNKPVSVASGVCVPPYDFAPRIDPVRIAGS